MLAPKLEEQAVSELEIFGAPTTPQSEIQLGDVVSEEDIFRAKEPTNFKGLELGEPVSDLEIFDPPYAQNAEYLDIPESRIASGLNSYAQRAFKAVFESFPKSMAALLASAGPGSVVPPVPGQGKEQKLEEIQKAAILEVPNSPLFKLGEQYGEYLEEVFPENPEYQDEWLAHHIPALLGDLTATVAASALGGPILGTAEASFVLSSSEYEAALRKTGDPQKAFDTFLLNLPVGATDMIPVGRLFKRLDDVTGGYVKQVLAKGFAGGLEELIQEVAQQFGTNLIAGETYDPMRDVWEEVVQSGAAGFGAGFLLNAMGVSTKGLLAKKGNVSLEEALDAEVGAADFKEPDNLNLDDIIDWQNVQIAEGEVVQDAEGDVGMSLEQSTSSLPADPYERVAQAGVPKEALFFTLGEAKEGEVVHPSPYHKLNDLRAIADKENKTLQYYTEPSEFHNHLLFLTIKPTPGSVPIQVKPGQGKYIIDIAGLEGAYLWDPTSHEELSLGDFTQSSAAKGLAVETTPNDLGWKTLEGENLEEVKKAYFKGGYGYWDPVFPQTIWATEKPGAEIVVPLSAADIEKVFYSKSSPPQIILTKEAADKLTAKSQTKKPKEIIPADVSYLSEAADKKEFLSNLPEGTYKVTLYVSEGTKLDQGYTAVPKQDAQHTVPVPVNVTHILDYNPKNGVSVSPLTPPPSTVALEVPVEALGAESVTEFKSKLPEDVQVLLLYRSQFGLAYQKQHEGFATFSAQPKAGGSFNIPVFVKVTDIVHYDSFAGATIYDPAGASVLVPDEGISSQSSKQKLKHLQEEAIEAKKRSAERIKKKLEPYIKHPIWGGGKVTFKRLKNPFYHLRFPVMSPTDPDVVTYEDLAGILKLHYNNLSKLARTAITRYIGADYADINLVYSEEARKVYYIDPARVEEFSQAAHEIEQEFSSVRARLRSVYGDTIRLYRYQRASKSIHPTHGVAGFSVSPKTAMSFGAGDTPGILFAFDMPLENIVWATDTYNEQEFIVRMTPEIRAHLNNKRGAETGRLGRLVTNLKKPPPLPTVGDTTPGTVHAPVGKRGFVGERAGRSLPNESKILISKRVGKDVHGLVSDVEKAFGFQGRVVVLSFDEIYGDDTGRVEAVIGKENVDFIKEQDNGHSYGSYAYDSKRDMHIILARNRGNIRDAVTRESLAHEIGHIVHTEFDRLPDNKEAVAKLKKLHTDFVNSSRKMNLEEFLRQRRLPGQAEELVRIQLEQIESDGYKTKDLRVEDLELINEKFYNYLTSYREWFADEFSKWLAVGSSEPRFKGVIGKYMKAFSNYMRKLYSIVFGEDRATSDPQFNDWIFDFLKANKLRGGGPPKYRMEIEFSTDDLGTGGRAHDGPENLPVKVNTDLEARERALIDPKKKGPRLRSFGINPDDELPKWKRVFLRFLHPRGLLPQWAYNIVKNEQALATAQMREAYGRLQEIYKLVDQRTAADKLRGLPPRIDPDVEAEMDHVLRGSREDIKRLVSNTNRRTSDELLGKMIEARRHIDRLSKTLIREGFVDGPLQLRIAQNLGFYLHRQYRVHIDPKWAEKVPEDILNRAKVYIREQFSKRGRNLNEREVETVIRRLLTDNDVQKALLTNTDLIGFDASILRDKKDIPAPIRALWGEIRNPVYNYIESIRLIADLVANQRALRNIKERGEGTIFFKRDHLFVPEGYDKRIQAEITDPLHPLAGYVTHPEILESLDEAFGRDKKINSAILSGLLKINGAAKVAKTIGNLMTWSRNFYGGTLFLAANGHLNPVKNVKTVTRVLREMTKSGVQPQKIRWAELGLYEQSIAAGELIDVFKDMGIQGPDMMSNFDLLSDVGAQWMNRWIKRPIRGATRAYQAIDTLLRVTMFELELERKQKALGISKNDPGYLALEEDVAQQIADTYQNYSRVPRAVRLLRRNVLAGPFVSFPYEAIRTAINTMQIAKAEIKHENPAIRRLGWTRAFSLLGTVFAGTIATAVSKSLIGMDDETDSDVDRLAAPWDRNMAKWYSHVGRGKVRYRNLGYTLPHTILERPLLTMLFRDDEESIGEAFTTSLVDFFSEFLGTEIAAQKALEIYSNQKATGSWVVNPRAPLSEKVATRALHFLDAFEPGTITAYQRVLKADRPLTEAGNEALEVFMGLREVELDVPLSFRYRALEFSRNRRDVRALATSVLRKSKDLNERYDAVDKAQQQYEVLWNELQDLYDSSFRLGVSDEELGKILEEAGVGKQLRKDLILGGFTPLNFENLEEVE